MRLIAAIDDLSSDLVDTTSITVERGHTMSAAAMPPTTEETLVVFRWLRNRWSERQIGRTPARQLSGRQVSGGSGEVAAWVSADAGEDEAFEVAAVAARRAADGDDRDPRLDRAVDAAVHAALAQGYRTAIAIIAAHGADASTVLEQRAQALDTSRGSAAGDA